MNVPWDVGCRRLRARRYEHADAWRLRHHARSIMAERFVRPDERGRVGGDVTGYTDVKEGAQKIGISGVEWTRRMRRSKV